MDKHKIKSFDELKHGDKVISPIDNEVTEFYIDRDGEKYLATDRSLFPIYQFTPEDFYIYDGSKNVGEVDEDYLKIDTPYIYMKE